MPPLTEFHFHVGASLSSLAQVSELLGSAPDEGISRGAVAPSGRVARETSWDLCEAVGPDGLEVAQLRMAARLEAVARRWAQRDRRDLEGKLCVLQVFEATDHGIHDLRFDRSWLDLVSSLDVSIDIDQYLNVGTSAELEAVDLDALPPTTMALDLLDDRGYAVVPGWHLESDVLEIDEAIESNDVPLPPRVAVALVTQSVPLVPAATMGAGLERGALRVLGPVVQELLFRTVIEAPLGLDA